MDQHILDSLAIQYNLSKLTFLLEPENGISTRNAIVADDRGQKYFIKNYKADHLKRLPLEEVLMEFVANNSNVPVLQPITNKDGELHTIVNEHIFGIYPFVEHVKNEPGNLAEELIFLETLGAMLGRIHGASKNKILPEQSQSPHIYRPSDIQKAIAKIKQMEEMILAKVARNEYDERALSFIQAKLSTLEASSFEILPEKEMVVCHGDFNRGNVVFNIDKEIIGVCDWDFSCISASENDLLRSFTMCVIKEDYERYTEKTEETRAFIKGYLENGGDAFTEEKMRYAIDLWYQKMATSLFPLYDHYVHGHTKGDHLIESELRKHIFVGKNKEGLLGHLMSCID